MRLTIYGFWSKQNLAAKDTHKMRMRILATIFLNRDKF